MKLSPDGPAEDLFQRFDDTKFTLIAFGQAAAEISPAIQDDLLRTFAIPSDPANDKELERARIPRPSFYLLRPDGHVGLAGVRPEAGAIARYFSERLSAPLSS